MNFNEFECEWMNIPMNDFTIYFDEKCVHAFETEWLFGIVRDKKYNLQKKEKKRNAANKTAKLNFFPINWFGQLISVGLNFWFNMYNTMYVSFFIFRSLFQAEIDLCLVWLRPRFSAGNWTASLRIIMKLSASNLASNALNPKKAQSTCIFFGLYFVCVWFEHS